MKKNNFITYAAIMLIAIFVGASVAAKEPLGIANASYAIKTGTDPHNVYSELVMGPYVPTRNLLQVVDSAWHTYTMELPHHAGGGQVFEGLSPMVADLDGDGLNEVVVTESDVIKGSSTAVYGIRGGELVKIAQTPYLGKRPQWTSMAGIADFDGDGINEIAQVEKPHGGNMFTILKLNGNKLERVAQLQGPTNHIEGTSYIQSDLRECNGTIQVLLTDHEFKTLSAVYLRKGKLVREKLGEFPGLKGVRKIAQAGCS